MADDSIPSREQLEARMRGLRTDPTFYAKWRAADPAAIEEFGALNQAIASAARPGQPASAEGDPESRIAALMRDGEFYAKWRSGDADAVRLWAEANAASAARPRT
jgi:hypothetical protein